MRNNKLPSRFQIGDDVVVQRDSGIVSMNAAKVIGVQFTEAKVHYLVTEDEQEPYAVVDSALVFPSSDIPAQA